MPRLVNGLEQIFTDLGIVGNGYKLFFFGYNTTTPKDTYSDQNLTIPNTNPVVCDASGRPETDIWGADPSTYKLVLATPDSVLGNITPVVTLDPVDSSNSGNIINLTPLPAAYWGSTTGTSTNYILDPASVPITAYSNVQCFFIDFHIACGNSPVININDLGEISLKKYTGLGTKTSLVSGDLQVQRYICINDGVNIVVLNPEHPANMPANTTTYRGLTYLPSRITIANNASDANNDIDSSAGVFQFADGSGQGVATALTKRLDASWVAGNNQGGLFSGSKANSTWYHCFAIYDPINKLSDFGFDTSIDAANRPAAYTGYKRVGSIRTNSSGNILAFTQTGIYFYLTTNVTDFNTTLATGESLKTLTTPLGVKTKAMFTFGAEIVSGTSSTAAIKAYSADITTPTITITNATGYASIGVTVANAYVEALTNTSSQIKTNAVVLSGSPTLSGIIVTQGWQDITL